MFLNLNPPQEESNIATNMAVISNLPDDLLVNILLRLPVKSALHCIFVCKLWYSLITCRGFISSHIINHHNKDHSSGGNDNDHPLIIQNGDQFTLRRDNENLDLIAELQKPCNGFISDSVNGLVCLQNFTSILLWNPLIGKMLEIPNPGEGNDGQEPLEADDFELGFGFDPLTGDYKVVAILPWSTQVFRLSTRCWTNFADISGDLASVSPGARQAYVSGHVNWVTSSRSVLAFEVGPELFKEMLLPEALTKRGFLRAIAWKGFLSVFGFNSEWSCLRHDNDDIKLWVMKEYGVTDSWMQLFRITPGCVYKEIRGVKPNGIIILQSSKHQLDYLDPEQIVTWSSSSTSYSSWEVKKFDLIKRFPIELEGYFCLRSVPACLALLDVGARHRCR